MKQILLPLLVAALITGGCATLPETPEQLEQWAVEKQVKDNRKKLSMRSERRVIFRRIAFKFDLFRAEPFFRKTSLVTLKALAMEAGNNWSAEIKATFFGAMQSWISREVLSYYRSRRTMRSVDLALLSVDADFRRLVRIKVLTRKEYMGIMGALIKSIGLDEQWLDDQLPRRWRY